MEIYIRGLASGYEPEHVARLFFQPALLAKRWPARGADAVAVLRGKKRFVCGVRTVSYTHLDVYKRQAGCYCVYPAGGRGAGREGAFQHAAHRPARAGRAACGGVHAAGRAALRCAAARAGALGPGYI